MGGTELLEALKVTGTGDGKLRHGRALLQERHDADAGAVINALAEAGVGEVTLAKAKHLAAGRPLADLLGKPPVNSRDAKEERQARMLREEIVGAIEMVSEKIAAGKSEAESLGIGNPKRPSAGDKK